MDSLPNPSGILMLNSCFFVAVLSVLTPLAMAAEPAQPQGSTPATFCRFVPERSDDFAWENDLVAFRVYGPALAKGSENSGIDCWAKRVTYPIIDKWYRLDLEEKISYHEDHGEGYDLYHVGKSRGCGGTAIWHNDHMVLSNVYKSWKVLETNAKKSVFALTYAYDVDGKAISETKTITIELGQRFFKSESVFLENGKPADLEIAVGLTTHNQSGVATLNRESGFISVWETIWKSGFGTGVVMDPARITGVQEIASKVGDESHAIVTTHTDADGRTVHYAGFAWDKSPGITTQKQWESYLADLGKSVAKAKH
jgi:hypothetical protein